MEDQHMNQNSFTANPDSIQTLPFAGCDSINSFTPFTNNYGGCDSVIFHGLSSSSYEDDDETKYPPGYRFLPTDKELIDFYLKGKIKKAELPSVPIHEVDLYKEDPRTLSGRYKSSGVENEWYFFTPRTKKYRNGSRPDRTANGGYWRASNTDILVDNAVGFKRSLKFHSGKPPGTKTPWLMQEYTMKDPPKCQTSSENSMRLDDWVLCKVYKKSKSKNRAGDAEVLSQEMDGGINVQTMNSVTIQPPSTNQIVHFSGYYGNETLYGLKNSMEYFVPSDNNCAFSDSLSDQFIGAPVEQIIGPVTSSFIGAPVEQIIGPVTTSSLGLVRRSVQNKRMRGNAFDNQQQYPPSSSTYVDC